MSAFECPKPRVLSRVTRTIKGRVYPWAAIEIPKLTEISKAVTLYSA